MNNNQLNNKWRQKINPVTAEWQYLEIKKKNYKSKHGIYKKHNWTKGIIEEISNKMDFNLSDEKLVGILQIWDNLL